MPRVIEASPYYRIAVFGEPKTWKTRLVTSLPWGKTWGEKAIYVAADPHAAALDSVLLPNRSRLIVIGYDEKEVRPGMWQCDPYTESAAIASRQWQAEYPQVGTLIWDTMTATARDLLHAIANAGTFSSEKHITVGKGQQTFNDPMQGDYKLAQGAIFQLINFLYKQPLHVICVFHSAATENGVYGPKTAGSATVRDVAGAFPHVFHTEVTTIPQEKGTVYTKRRGQWLGSFGNPNDVNPLPSFVLPPDPSEFWRKFEEAARKEAK